jgi:GNAT superfamily N-acetyltransferase
VTGPDPEWAQRLLPLLAHKGGVWNWQNEVVLGQPTGIEARFYVLHRDGQPLANVLTATCRGVGHLGHVFTVPADRGQGAASLLLELTLADFRARGGQALYLGTGHGSSAYRIYQRHGFVGVAPGSGYMEFHAGAGDGFEDRYLAAGEATPTAVDWPHWPASATLFLAPGPELVRAAPVGLLGRASSEHALLDLLWSVARAPAEGQELDRARVLVRGDNGAVVGLACWAWDGLWPDTCLVDVYCAPRWWEQAPPLLAALPLPPGARRVAYTTAGAAAKGQALLSAGLRPRARHVQRLADPGGSGQRLDVLQWEA